MSNPGSADLPVLAVLGAGAWGTTLAIVYARQGRQVTLLTRDAHQAAALRATRENQRYLPGLHIPRSVAISAEASALAEADVVLFVTPSQALRSAGELAATWLKPDALLVSCAKGFERDTWRRLTETLADEHRARRSASAPGRGQTWQVRSPTACPLLPSWRPATRLSPVRRNKR